MNVFRNHLDLAVPIVMAIVAALGTLLLGLGQQSVFLPSIAVLAAVTSVVLTDWLGRFRLNRNIANVAALLAVAYALVDFRGRQDSETQLLAVANLLVYLQIVLQFQEKGTRVYWSLSVLSLLQVVVASALNLNVSFGPLLAVYLVFALTGLYLTFIQRETQRFELSHRQDAAAMPPVGPRRRWPLGTGASNWTDSVADDPAGPLLEARLWRHILWMVGVTMVVTMLVFFGMPRQQRRVWQSPMTRVPSVVGFSQEVSLGSMGRILQSDESVMRVVFYRDDARRPLQFKEEPYFRGATLNTYQRTGGYGRWSQRGESYSMMSLEPPPPGRGTVIQEITLQLAAQPARTSRRHILFGMFPAYLDSDSPPGIEVDRASNQLLISADAAPQGRQAFRYLLRTGGLRGTQPPRLLGGRPDPLGSRLAELTLEQQQSFSGLSAVADNVIRQAGTVDTLRKSLALEAYFLQPGRFTYSLDPDVTPTPNLDPIEDFVMNHRTGHCEYFASALVLMLRSQAIPARMVVGYKGVEFNSVGGFYQVRQKHAHAWVEVFLRPDELKLDQLPDVGMLPPGEGAWLRLDPTAADLTAEQDDAEISLLARIKDAAGYLQLLWNDYVLGLNSDRQREAIYQPILDGLNRWWQSLRARNWTVLFWLLVALVASAGAALVVWLKKWRTARPHRLGDGGFSRPFAEFLSSPLRWLADWWTSRERYGTPRGAVEVAFYNRLEQSLARFGLRRTPQQTQREFAALAGGRLADLSQLQASAGVPRRIAEAFYRVRFGGVILSPHEHQAIEEALAQLEAAIARQSHLHKTAAK